MIHPLPITKLANLQRHRERASFAVRGCAEIEPDFTCLQIDPPPLRGTISLSIRQPVMYATQQRHQGLSRLSPMRRPDRVRQRRSAGLFRRSAASGDGALMDGTFKLLDHNCGFP